MPRLPPASAARRTALILALLPPAAAAGEFFADAGLGYLATDGNTSSRSINAKLDLGYEESPWKNVLKLAAINTKGETSAERYFAGNKLDYGFTPRDYVFALAEYEKDLAGAIRERTSATLGYGRHVLVGPVHLLDAEIGAGARRTEANGTGEKSRDAVGRGSLRYEWKLTDKSGFTEALKVESGAANTLTESVSELKLPVHGDLSALLSYTVRNNSDAPPGTEHTDTATAVTLSYTFGKKP